MLTMYGCVSSSSALHHTILISSSYYHTDPHSFPTRRSSDLEFLTLARVSGRKEFVLVHALSAGEEGVGVVKIDERFEQVSIDRKSTRLNSSHANISYAVRCFKKKIFWTIVCAC